MWDSTRDLDGWMRLRCAPADLHGRVWGRSWDQVGGEERAPDLVPLPRQDTGEGQDSGGAAEAKGSKLWIGGVRW